MNAKQIEAIRKIVAEFVVNQKDDYDRMDKAVFAATKVRLDNKSIWGLVNRAKKQVERVSFTLDD